MSGVENFKDCDLIDMLIGRDTQVVFMDDFGRIIDLGYIVGQTKTDVIFSNRFIGRDELPIDGSGISYISNSFKWAAVVLVGSSVIILPT